MSSTGTAKDASTQKETCLLIYTGSPSGRNGVAVVLSNELQNGLLLQLTVAPTGPLDAKSVRSLEFPKMYNLK